MRFAFWRAKHKEFSERLPALQAWLQSEAGRDLVNEELLSLNPMLAYLFGHHMLTLGLCPDLQMLEQSRVQHNFALAPSKQPLMGNYHIVCKESEWPVAECSVDTVLLHHALEFSSAPQVLLREATRVIIPGGKLLLIGFNPWSLSGLLRFLPFSKVPIRSGHYISKSRLEDWLQLLGFRIDAVEYGRYFPFAGRNRLGRFSVWLKRLGRRFNLPLGGFYIIVAHLEEPGATHIKPAWTLRSQILAGARLQPRGQGNNKV